MCATNVGLQQQQQQIRILWQISQAQRRGNIVPSTIAPQLLTNVAGCLKRTIA